MVAVPASAFRERDQATAFVVIEALAVWSSFARYYYLSASLGAVDAAGSPICGSCFASVDAALTLAVHTTKPQLSGDQAPWRPADEPVWHTPADFRKVMRALAARNYTQITNALSARTSVFNDMPTFRNFYAHREGGTARKARLLGTRYLQGRIRKGGSSTRLVRLHPTEILNSHLPSHADSIIVEWIDDLGGVLGLFA